MSLPKILLSLFDFKGFRGKTGPEDDISIEVAAMLRAASLEGKLSAVWSSVPAEVGAVSKHSQGFGGAMAKYAKQKAMGFNTGVSDFVFVWPDGGGWIELKTKTGQLSPAQRLFRDWCAETNVRHAVCRSCDEVRSQLKSWGVLRA